MSAVSVAQASVASESSVRHVPFDVLKTGA